MSGKFEAIGLNSITYGSYNTLHLYESDRKMYRVPINRLTNTKLDLSGVKQENWSVAPYDKVLHWIIGLFQIYTIVCSNLVRSRRLSPLKNWSRQCTSSNSVEALLDST